MASVDQNGRRALLRSAGVGAAALLATGLSVAKDDITGTAPTASANDGSPILAGSTNTTSAGTSLIPAAGAAPPFLLRADATGRSTFTGSAPIAGVGATDGDGLDGIAIGNNAVGTAGMSDAGWGAIGYTLTGIDVAALGTGRLFQEQAGFAGAPTGGSYLAGEQIRDTNGNLFICVTSGTPGAWKQVATTDMGLQSFPNPRRILTLNVIPGTVTGPLDATASIGSGVPVGARSAYCAVQSYNAGVLTLFPDGMPDPLIANWSGLVDGPLNMLYMLVPLSSAGKYRLHAYFTGTVYIDVWGYLP